MCLFDLGVGTALGRGLMEGVHGSAAGRPQAWGPAGPRDGGITEAGRRVEPMPEWRPVNAGTFAVAPVVEERVVALAASWTRTAV